MRFLSVGLAGLFSALALAPGTVFAEDSPFGLEEKEPTGFDVDGWELRPLADVRVRGEYRPFPTNDGIFGERPILRVGNISTAIDAVDDQILVWERVRLGFGVKKGPLSVGLTMQDARSIGYPDRGRMLSGQPALPVTAPYEGWIDVATDDRSMFFRLGRQEIVIGDGRLVGRSDDLSTGRTFDAARGYLRFGDFDLQAVVAMLVPPGQKQDSTDFAAGSQLYVLDASWKPEPFIGAELTGIARIVREPLVDALTPSDVFVAAARVFGDYRGVRYSVLGAFEGGRVALQGTDEQATLIAGAAAGRVEWETALPWHFTFGAQGAFASGGPEEGQVPDLSSFDPIFPDSTAHFGQGGFYALTNLIEAGGDVAAKPIDELFFEIGYRFAGLADPNGKWYTAALFPVGQSASNTSHVLGHVAYFDFRAKPWQYLDLGASYWILVFGDGATAIFEDTRPTLAAEAPAFSEMAMLDARLVLP